MCPYAPSGTARPAPPTLSVVAPAVCAAAAGAGWEPAWDSVRSASVASTKCASRVDGMEQQNTTGLQTRAVHINEKTTDWKQRKHSEH